ncbi:hypothetical protein [Dyella caseinilytica]|uniref:Uncharacterized protein n=1 Tax=Dyella caseinilytica TaxID=1849581 RepID=A0ABX7GXM3_9GAMM|nr:hypothetical protein [Dyella caseinilytica]QRN55238.1 hypothetical protein ISN74_07885 [Dyella caseinilytica]GGA00335.1 hypothetical protein GCM10011408_21550 [Dyella caseinilytica]
MTLAVRITHPTEYPAKAQVTEFATDGNGALQGEGRVVATLEPGQSYDGYVYQSPGHGGSVLIVREVH